jgi:hypothetical protein
MYQADRVGANVTIGEAAIMAALATEVDPEHLEGWAVISFVHRDPFTHDLVIKSNLSDSIEALCGLFFLAMNVSTTLEDASAELNQDSKGHRIRSKLWHGHSPEPRG